MNVTGLSVNGLGQNGIDVFDDGGAGCMAGEVGVSRIIIGIKDFARELLEEIVHAIVSRTVKIIDAGFDLGEGGDDDVDIAVAREAEVVDGLLVEGIEKGDGNACFIDGNRESALHTRGMGRDGAEEFGSELGTFEADVIDSEMGGDHGEEVAFVGDAEIEDDLLDGFACAIVFVAEVFGLLLFDEALICEEGKQKLGIHISLGLQWWR